MTPADTMTAAADKLDALLADATHGPWQCDGPYHHDRAHGVSEESGLVTAGEHRDAVLLGLPPWVDKDRGEGNVRYAAAMHPDVGRALAALLRGVARWYQVNGTTTWPGGTDNFRELVRAILGTREDT